MHPWSQGGVRLRGRDSDQVGGDKKGAQFGNKIDQKRAKYAIIHGCWGVSGPAAACAGPHGRSTAGRAGERALRKCGRQSESCRGASAEQPGCPVPALLQVRGSCRERTALWAAAAGWVEAGTSHALGVLHALVQGDLLVIARKVVVLQGMGSVQDRLRHPAASSVAARCTTADAAAPA